MLMGNKLVSLYLASCLRHGLLDRVPLISFVPRYQFASSEGISPLGSLPIGKVNCCLSCWCMSLVSGAILWKISS